MQLEKIFFDINRKVVLTLPNTIACSDYLTGCQQI
jgi:hypothetical protein